MEANFLCKNVQGYAKESLLSLKSLESGIKPFSRHSSVSPFSFKGRPSPNHEVKRRPCALPSRPSFVMRPDDVGVIMTSLLCLINRPYLMRRDESERRWVS